jgi:glycosyltransferase involved in cell wall biosynthesis
MPKRRIVLISAPHDGTGAAKQAAIVSRSMGLQPVSSGRLAHGLEAHAAEEFDLHVLSITSGGPVSRTVEAPTTAIELRGPCDLAGLWKGRRALKRLRPDLVHTWGPQANLCGRIAALSAGVSRLLTTEYCVDPLRSAARWWLDLCLAKRTDGIVAVSPQVRRWCLAGGLPANKVRVIPGGVSLATTAADRSAILAGLDLPADARLIAAAAPLESRNRLKDIIWAAELLHFIRDDVHLLIIGDGSQRAMLARYCDLIQVTGHVHFLGCRDDTQRLISCCDLLWFAGGHEGQPWAVMEALAAGVPVVAADTPGVRELMTDAMHGYLVPLGDRAALARYANMLIDDAEQRARFGAAGRDKMQQEFSPRRLIESYAALYRELLQ